MHDINYVLSSSEQYKQAFEEGLTSILQHQTAGTFILACANLFQHPEFLQNNRILLHEVYCNLKTKYLAYNRDNQQPDDAPDDITVMNNLIAIDLENLQDVEYCETNGHDVDYILNYNQLRSFRPARMSKTDTILLDIPFNLNGFHFDKAFLKKEVFAEGEIEGKQLSLLYNKFPFIHYHALLVIDKTSHNNQYLTQEYLDYIYNLQIQTQQHCPDFVVAYNSLGAGASVNHLHFHTYLETMSLPVFSPLFTHNGGKQCYPATCLTFTNTPEAWRTIESFHINNTPYNLLLKNKKIYCLPRKTAQVDITGIDTSMFGWSHMAGLINIDNRTQLMGITAEILTSCLKSVSANI